MIPPRLQTHFLPGGMRGWRTLHMIKEFLDREVPAMKKNTVGSRIAAIKAASEWLRREDKAKKMLEE